MDILKEADICWTLPMCSEKTGRWHSPEWVPGLVLLGHYMASQFDRLHGLKWLDESSKPPLWNGRGPFLRGVSNCAETKDPGKRPTLHSHWWAPVYDSGQPYLGVCAFSPRLHGRTCFWPCASGCLQPVRHGHRMNSAISLIHLSHLVLTLKETPFLSKGKCLFLFVVCFLFDKCNMQISLFSYVLMKEGSQRPLLILG